VTCLSKLNHASIDDNLLYGYLDITPYLFVTVQVQWLLIYYLQPSERSFAWGWVEKSLLSAYYCAIA